MKKCTLLLLFILFSIFLSSAQTSTIIQGQSKEQANEKVYLKNYDPFQYNSNTFILDSVIVSPNGEFEFEIQLHEPKLIIISNDTKLPPTYSVLREAPSLYYFSFCVQFYTVYPTLFISPGNTYNITHWDTKNKKESIIHNEDENNILRHHYSTQNFLKSISAEEDGSPLEIDPNNAWHEVQKIRNNSLEEIRIQTSVLDTEFVNYMETEIKLGALNSFLLWYTNQPYFDIDLEFYSKLLNTYENHNFNPLSLELFKLTERIVAFKMLNHTNEVYCKVSQQKIEIAQKYAYLNIKEKYIEHLQNQEQINKISLEKS
ncbi:MAG: hypothetical protein P1U56_21315 [Saprospiraceae bacterium]|nr:hypothetical protein [Saprospiraceae bacterium]